MKRIYNRKIRRSKEENPYRNYKKRNQSWNICDFKCHAYGDNESEWNELDWKAYRRK